METEWTFEQDELLIELSTGEIVDIHTISNAVGKSVEECRRTLTAMTRIWLEMHTTDDIRKEAIKLAKYLESIETRREKLLRGGCSCFSY